MKRILYQLKNFLKLKKVGFYLQLITIEGGMVALVLSLVSLILIANIIRVVSNGRGNYETYLYEKKVLGELQQKNNELNSELGYVNSDEYRKLFLRDNQSLAAPNEELYNTKPKPVYFDERKEYIDLRDKNDYSDWWGLLLK